MPTLPKVSCPRCRRSAEYQATVEMLDPPVGKIDVGFCEPCACLFEQVRDTGTAYDSTAWPPVCRKCRQPVTVVKLMGNSPEQIVRFQCRDHEDERWEWRQAEDRWRRVS